MKNIFLIARRCKISKFARQAQPINYTVVFAQQKNFRTWTSVKAKLPVEVDFDLPIRSIEKTHKISPLIKVNKIQKEEKQINNYEELPSYIYEKIKEKARIEMRRTSTFQKYEYEIKLSHVLEVQKDLEKEYYVGDKSSRELVQIKEYIDIIKNLIKQESLKKVHM
ncbi:MAG: hypothetical protein Edafosvirus3_82 [Edafosvirus sp.]|uniref:Uncharacterized protein n=1 Tax=Edafosvirus sp. TaxID=2487765 RepID=A0A3G4ZUL4_9VIRU|nr:MAG: hypothetical protein Edafosvirus3_82 [Edafosvirus sp.]